MNNHIEYIFKKGIHFYEYFILNGARICPFRAQSYHPNSYISHQSANCQLLEVPITFHACLWAKNMGLQLSVQTWFKPT